MLSVSAAPTDMRSWKRRPTPRSPRALAPNSHDGRRLDAAAFGAQRVRAVGSGAVLSERASQTSDGLQREALRDICFSAGVKRSHHEFRLALVAHDNAELAEQLEAFLAGESRANSSNGRISGTPSNPVFVCSGMGQQWWAMGRELLAQEPVFRRAVEEVSDLFGRLAGWSLLDKLTADEQSSQIQETHIGQPAIFALQVALGGAVAIVGRRARGRARS